jgi:heme-degrading monooxygenase HmoA
MKPIVPLLAIAIFALSPFTSADAQTSPSRRAPAEKKASSTPPLSKPSISPVATASDNSIAGSPAAAPASTTNTRTDVYNVYFGKAALGKAKQLADFLKSPNPENPSGHALVLRHQEGDSWDYAVIQHIGPKATVEAVRPAPPASARDLSDWHNDTFVNGPPWSEFAKAMGIEEAGDKARTAGSVYVVSVHRPAAGHRDDLEKMLSERPSAGDSAAGNVLMQHLEGGPWSFLVISRYNSWSDFATSDSNSVAETAKNQDSGWFKLREHASFHTDTLCDRIAP